MYKLVYVYLFMYVCCVLCAVCCVLCAVCCVLCAVCCALCVHLVETLPLPPPLVCYYPPFSSCEVVAIVAECSSVPEDGMQEYLDAICGPHTRSPSRGPAITSPWHEDVRKATLASR
jgi:hypothetical protein